MLGVGKRGFARQAGSAWRLNLAVAVAVGAIPLIAVSRLLAPDLVATHDGLYHIFRAVQLEDTLREGVLYPRWAGDFVQGLGYPVFHFYAPLGSYLLVGLHALGLAYVDALDAGLIVAYLLGAAGMYAWARTAFGRPGALLASVAYIYSPYVLFDTYVRADLPEVLALALLPWVLWAFYGIVRHASLVWLLVGALLFAAVVVTHNLTAFFFVPLLTSYAMAMLIARPSRSGLLLVAGALLLSLTLSAFYWLPAFGEKGLVQIQLAVDGPRFDFHSHFLSLDQLFGVEPPADPREGNAWFSHRAGVVQVGLALLGVLFCLSARGRRERTASLIWATAAGATLLLLVTAGSAAFWETMPLVAFIQFPWRLLGMASLCVAFAAAGALEVFSAGAPGDDGRAWSLGPAVALSVAAAAIVLSVASYLYPTESAVTAPNPTLADALAYERNTETIGTTTRGEFLPLWVQWIPPDTGQAVSERLDRGVLGPDSPVKANLLAHAGQYEAYQIETPRDQTLLFKLLYYPFWRGYVDGAEVPLEPFTEYGLGWTTLQVPPGDHLVELRVEDTPLTRLGNAISLGSGLVLLTGLGVVTRRRARASSVESGAAASGPYARWAPASLALVMIAFFVLKVGWVDAHTDWFRAISPPGTVARADSQVVADFEGQIISLGFALDRREARAGDTLRLRIYWEPLRDPMPNLGSVVQLVPNAGARPVAEWRGLHAKWIPTRHWRLGYYYEDEQSLALPKGVKPGEYTLLFGMYEPGDDDRKERRLSVVGTQPPRNYAVLDKITVLP